MALNNVCVVVQPVTPMHRQNMFHLAELKPGPHETTPHPPTSQPPATTILLSFSMHLTPLGASQKYNHIVFVFS